MCALSPSPTEAHAGTLLFLRSDGPLYNCTRATALWLSSGGPDTAKRKCPSLPQSSQFRIKTGRDKYVKYESKHQLDSSSAAMVLKEITHQIRTTTRLVPDFSVSEFTLTVYGWCFFFSIPTKATFTRDLYAHEMGLPITRWGRFYRPLFNIVLNKHYKGVVFFILRHVSVSVV